MCTTANPARICTNKNLHSIHDQRRMQYLPEALVLAGESPRRCFAESKALRAFLALSTLSSPIHNFSSLEGEPSAAM